MLIKEDGRYLSQKTLLKSLPYILMQMFLVYFSMNMPGVTFCFCSFAHADHQERDLFKQVLVKLLV